ncbi:DUF2017 domain-containing protein [Salinibacterium sp. ZJ454]|uniref:DUF2017 domain-containing protein n=1 Tax=Salinibacterium sp. ZJ454 TaxID=2708339 RepID=UPI0014210CCC|nr:DUF2017 domain-containing protein [Salinibacterium sp. ZJ454]
MTPWTRDDDNVLSAEFSDIETAILRDLARQVGELVESADHRDPALARLLPDAYRDDPAAAAEFRRLTAADLTARKAAGIRLIGAMLSDSDSGRVVVTDPQALDWMRALTDIRLVIASRLGIEEDGDEGRTDSDEDLFLRNAFDWLGFVQDSIVQALEDTL